MKNPPTSVGRSTPIGRNFLDRGFNFLDNPAIHALPSGFHRQAGQERAWHRSAAPGCRDLLERRQLAHHCRVHGNRGREALRSPRARESAGRRSCASGAAVVAKVDRLTRSVAFLSRLLEAGVDVRFADFPMIEGATQIPSAANGRRCRAGFYMAMPDFPIDPELHIRGSSPRVLRRTTEAMAFIQQMTLSRFGRTWLDVQQSFEEARDQSSAMEAVVKLELLLEAEGLLIEGKPASASTLSLQHPSRAA